MYFTVMGVGRKTIIVEIKKFANENWRLGGIGYMILAILAVRGCYYTWVASVSAALFMIRSDFLNTGPDNLNISTNNKSCTTKLKNIFYFFF